MLTDELALAPPGITVAGENAQDIPTGRFEHESATVWFNAPDCGETVTVAFAG